MDQKRKDVFEKLIKEREYQDIYCELRELPKIHNIDNEVIILNKYINKCLKIRAEGIDDQSALTEIRKIASIAIRCLENHGCPERNQNDLMFNN